MDRDPSRAARIMLTFDPEGLSLAQREGEVCVVCHRRWPRPRVRVGRLPDRATVLACHECAEVIDPAPAARVADLRLLPAGIP